MNKKRFYNNWYQQNTLHLKKTLGNIDFLRNLRLKLFFLYCVKKKSIVDNTYVR